MRPRFGGLRFALLAYCPQGCSAELQCEAIQAAFAGPVAQRDEAILVKIDENADHEIGAIDLWRLAPVLLREWSLLPPFSLSHAPQANS